MRSFGDKLDLGILLLDGVTSSCSAHRANECASTPTDLLRYGYNTSSMQQSQNRASSALCQDGTDQTAPARRLRRQ